MNANEYLQRFFSEKEIQYKEWQIADKNGNTNFIDTEVVKEAIMNCPPSEKVKIANVLRRIDFVNGNVLDFLFQLAKGLVYNYSI